MSADHELDAIARADQASPIEARKILVAEIERLRAALTEIAELQATVPWHLTAKTLREMARHALEHSSEGGRQ